LKNTDKHSIDLEYSNIPTNMGGEIGGYMKMEDMEVWMVNDERGHGRMEGIGGWKDMEECRVKEEDGGYKNGGYE